MISMAGLLATVVLAATAGGDAASAAMITSQALSMDNQLRYSRSNEQEADRVGLTTMERANRDPGQQIPKHRSQPQTRGKWYCNHCST